MRIYINLEAETDMTVEELWPDGDAPNVITPEAVQDRLKELGGAATIIADWGLSFDIIVTIWDSDRKDT